VAARPEVEQRQAVLFEADQLIAAAEARLERAAGRVRVAALARGETEEEAQAVVQRHKRVIELQEELNRLWIERSHIAREIAELEEKQTKRTLAEEVKLLRDASRAHVITLEHRQRALEIEQALTAQLQNANLELGKRLEIMGQLEQLRGIGSVEIGIPRLALMDPAAAAAQRRAREAAFARQPGRPLGEMLGLKSISEIIRPQIEDAAAAAREGAGSWAQIAEQVRIARQFVDETIMSLTRYSTIQSALDVALEQGLVTSAEYAAATDALREAMAKAAGQAQVSAAQMIQAFGGLLAFAIGAARGGGGGGFLGGLLSAVGGIASLIPGGQAVGAGLLAGGMVISALSSGGGRTPVPVRVDGYGPSARGFLERIQGPDVFRLSIYGAKTGDLIDEFIYENLRRQRRDAVIRLPRGVLIETGG
jgi:hypothetical protein